MDQTRDEDREEQKKELAVMPPVAPKGKMR
jgi:hypothetical protein